MSSEHKLAALAMLLGALLLFALGYAMHLNAIRSDAVVLACINQGRTWIVSDARCVAGRAAQ